MTNTDEKLFDFSDVSDIPEESRPRTHGRKPTDPWQCIVSIVAAAPRPVKLSEIRGALYRRDKITPCAYTVRRWLNKAVQEGHLIKVSNQRYFSPEGPGQNPPAQQEEHDAPHDPLMDALM